MKSASSPQRVFGHIEPLEARIAPARLIDVGAPNAGGPGSPNEFDYDEAPFVNTENADPNDLIAQAVGPGMLEQADTFYLRLSAGDTLRIYNGDNGFQEYLTVHSGSLVAFFVDLNNDNEVQEGELTSLSLGKNASVTLRGGLAGSVVTNLDDKGTASPDDDTIQMNGLVSGQHGIKQLTLTKGDILGKVLAGGDISKVTLQEGVVGDILVGSAADGETFEIFPGITSSQGTISFVPKTGERGGSISNVFIEGVGHGSNLGRIEAGAGGLGAAGGSLKNIRFAADFDGFTLRAGDGGAAATETGKGGAGGSISTVIIPGARDSVANESIGIHAGDGGDSLKGAGGIGGSVSNVSMGYQFFGSKLFPSGDLLKDNVTISSGDGGDGKIGGKAGNLTKLDLRMDTPDMADAPNFNEIVITGGTGGGGEDLAGAKAGVGGSLSQFTIFNNSATPATVQLQAGDGGVAEGVAKGANGGSITNAKLTASGMDVRAGNGSDGSVGGAGGNLSNVSVEVSVVAHAGVFNAGMGGYGSAGNGGKGGNIDRLMVKGGDFSALEINSGNAADGGSSVGGRGGIGGSITKTSILEADSGGSYTGEMVLRTGNGGHGTKGGGNAGSLVTFDFTSEDFSANIQAGTGGSAQAVDANGSLLGEVAALGKGGAGGLVKGVRITAEGVLVGGNDPVYPSTSVRAGAGGSGAGERGSGGAGGDINNLSVNVDGDASVVAGGGGNGAELTGDKAGKGGAAGKGGSIIQAGVRVATGGGELIAGNAGLLGDGPGVGGSILAPSATKLTGLYASQSISIIAGDGFNGGAGGSIRNVGYGSYHKDGELTPTPTGDIEILAGDGSGEGRFAGAGGSITNVTGTVSSGADTHTHIYAGMGGGSADKSAAGGSISNITIQRGGSFSGAGPLTELRILAGDAGDGGENVRTGAKGGDVRNVRIFDISNAFSDTVIRSIAAGDGGDAALKGGAGGTLDRIFVVNHDIGVRSGEWFGYDHMGGLFAGEGGNSAEGAAGKGLSGNVTNVTATAIAAIVAGRGEIPVMAEKVESIYLSGLGGTEIDPLRVEPEDGKPSDLQLSETAGKSNFFAFRQQAYDSATLVGAVYEPTRVDANKFGFTSETDPETGEPIIDPDTGRPIYAADSVTYDPTVHRPIDGLIMARVFNQAKVNFTPEARVVNGVFYDWDNRNA